MIHKLAVQTPPGDSLVDITAAVNATVQQSQVKEGICVLFAPHTTAALTINSAMDANTVKDVVAEVRRLVPTRVDFHHIFDTPADAAGHIKAVLVGGSQTLIVSGGELLLGHSQSIFLYEFDGPRSRQVIVRVLADCDQGSV
ncbi:MAG TPA: secondary thiamine-phosphate synthase enzyme YjbQ [Levilinea sp.]|nr:secondary thiamine-phosphate synthase enzyme YjbQ [Levilinea sp.]